MSILYDIFIGRKPQKTQKCLYNMIEIIFMWIGINNRIKQVKCAFEGILFSGRE